MKRIPDENVSELRERGYDPSIISEIEESQGIATRLKNSIRRAFKDTPYPGSEYTDISATDYDEGVYQYFVGSDQFYHPVHDLRCNYAALSFFTPEAFRYWLPAFMIAELDDPEEADVIAGGIAFHLSEAQGAHALILGFADDERSVIKDFFTECIRRYPCAITSECFHKALAKISKAEQGAVANP